MSKKPFFTLQGEFSMLTLFLNLHFMTLVF